ncbi:MAG: phosphoenolpyruvate--protein phosphotransferase [Chloroflexaceae bacterium]
MIARSFTGLAAAPGLATGAVLVYRATAARPETPADPAIEQTRLIRAIAETDATIAAHEAALRAAGQTESAAIFAAHRLLLNDHGLRERAAALVSERGQAAADAILTAAEEQAIELERLGDAYLSARAADVRAVAMQVWRALTGAGGLSQRLVTPSIVVARDLDPADLAGAPRDLLRGIALAVGGLTAHASIIARSLGIPAVVGLGDEILTAAAGARTVVLDGDNGLVLLDPPADQVAARLRARPRECVTRGAVARGPVTTRDGRRIRLLANVASPAEARDACAEGAEGVGLLRTEWLFLERPDLPNEEEQVALYQAVAAAMPDAPITVRTLDIGGDKRLPALPLPREDNPFLGSRGLRVCLSRPEIFLPQLRALLRARAAHDIRILLPMVTTVAEVRRTRALLEQAQHQLAAAGRPFAATIPLGVMIEVPAAALNAGHLAREATFFSLGTNDLTQYTLACDRGNHRLADLYQPLDPAVLRLIRMACDAAHHHSRPAGICGELSGDPQVTALLIGLGADELTCAPPALARVRAAVAATDTRAARDLAERALAAEGPEQVRALLGKAL